MTSGDNNFSRRWGGTRVKTVDPYITGYHFINFVYLPSTLEANVTGSFKNLGGLNAGAIKNVLASACLSVTIPGATVNKAEFNGLGNIKFAVPSNVDWDNTVTIRFLESSGLPILGIMHGWVRMIRDYRAGVSALSEQGQYTKSNYAATMYYWTTEPNGKQVEYHSCMTGMYPLKDPTDQFGHDITAYDKLEIDIDWNVDYLWHEAWTESDCQSLAEKYWGAFGGGANNSSMINGTYSSGER
jgi:hypothetical protein